jgi:hypothetical protein
MKKVFTLIAVTGLLSFGTVHFSAQDAVVDTVAQSDSIADAKAAVAKAAEQTAKEEAEALAKAETEANSKPVELTQEEPDISQTILY